MKCCKAIFLALVLLIMASACGNGEDGGVIRTRRIREDTVYLCSEFGSRVTGTSQEREACDWLEEQLKAMGFSEENGTLSREAFQGLDELTSENLVVRFNPGEDTPIYCAVAHYDSVAGSPGARDNASAVAILLEIARNLEEYCEFPEGEIRLVFLGSEENGYHGSRAYLESLTDRELERHKTVFNMDISAATAGEGQLVCCTLGGEREGVYQSGDFLEPMDNTASHAIARACEMLYKQTVPVVHGGESDHVTFHQWEIDSANVCWRRVEDGIPVLPPEYHGADDVPETIDYETAEMTALCVLEALHCLV